MELLTIGKISGSHHLKGAVKVLSNIDNLNIILNNKVAIEIDKNNPQILTVKNVSQLVGNRWVVEFEEITNKTIANSLKNGFIKIRRELLGLADDEYLLNDLLGMIAIDIDNGEKLGEIVDIFETPAHDILVIDSKNEEIMVPDVDEFIKKIDFEKRKIFVQLIAGMKEEKGKKYIQDDGENEEDED